MELLGSFASCTAALQERNDRPASDTEDAEHLDPLQFICCFAPPLHIVTPVMLQIWQLAWSSPKIPVAIDMCDIACGDIRAIARVRLHCVRGVPEHVH